MASNRTRKLLVLALCLHSMLVFSQATFQKTIGGPGNEVGTWVIETMGGYLVAGHVTNSSGNQDALLIRVDGMGNPLWQKRFGAAQKDAFHAVIATLDGGFLAVGETSSFGSGNADIFIVKIDSLGTVVWSRTAGDANREDVARSVIPVPGGGFIISGSSESLTTTFSNSIFMRLDQQGNTLWSRTYTSNSSNAFLSNYMAGNIIYASGGIDGEAAMLRLDLATGNILSSKSYAGLDAESLNYQQPTQDGNIVLADHTRSSPVGTNVDMWVQKVNPITGQVIWSKIFFRANDNIRGRIEKVDDGGFLLIPYDNFNATQSDALIAKIDANGNLLWSRNFGGGASDRLFKAIQTGDQGFIVVGDTRSNSGNFSSDILLVKTNSLGRVEGSCAKDAGILSANYSANYGSLSANGSAWIQTTPLNTNPLPLSLSGQAFAPNPSPTILSTIPLCPNQSFTVGGVAHFAPTMVMDTLMGMSGCDTVIKYDLTLQPFVSGIHVIGLCAGETYTIDGIAYSAPATVVDTVASTTGGCDTLCTFVLKAWAQPTESQTISFCPGESVMIGGQVYTQPGTVQATIPNPAGGCDILVTYTLEERPSPTRATTIAFCPGESVIIGGVTYSQSGTVVSTIPSTNNGCDTIVTYTLVLQQQPTRTETRGFCPGESVIIAGQAYNQPGTVVATIPSTNQGCDTIVTYHLEIIPQPTLSRTLDLCPGESVNIAGQNYNQSGTVMAILPATAGGCDTLATFTLILHQQPTRSETLGLCPGESVTIAGQTYNQPGMVVAHLPGNAGGCDTIVTYTLQIQSQPTRAEILRFCPGETVTIANQIYNQPGVVVAYQPSPNGGCDTVVTYTLQYLTPAPSNVAISCPDNITQLSPSGAGAVAVNYVDPFAASDCLCDGLVLTRTSGLASGSMFPVGASQVCYKAKDNCGQERSCCFSVTVREDEVCDSKINGCLKYEMLSITTDNGGNHTYRIRVTNSCANKLVYTAIQIPNGITAMYPYNNTTYVSPEGRSYLVRSPNFSPMYSIRFKSTTDSIAHGQSDVFEYTLPAQAQVSYINITSTLSNQSSNEVHLNTIHCPVGVNNNNRASKSRDASTVIDQNSLLLFPNPTTGVLFADLSSWQGQKLQVQITNTQGQQVHTLHFTAQEDLLRVEMPQGLANGIYFMEVSNEKGEKEVLRFMFQR